MEGPSVPRRRDSRAGGTTRAKSPERGLALPLPRARLAARALGIGWRAAPPLLLVTIVAQAGLAVTPVVSVWAGKNLVDTITARQSPVPAVVGMVATSAAFALFPPLLTYLRGEIERRMGLAIKVELTRAVDRLVGLARHESPAFVNRLALASRASGTAPLQLVFALLRMGSSVLTISGYLVTVTALAPLLAVVAVLGMMPILVGRLWLVQLSALSAVRLNPTLRREGFFHTLLISLPAAKEIRLFGFGGWLLDRMIRELTAINAERRSVARSEQLTETLMGLLSAAIAAAGLIWATQRARAGQLTAGEVVALTQGMIGVQGSVGGTIGWIAEINMGLINTGHFVTVVDAEPDLPVRDPASGRPPVVAGERGLVLDDVWFRYAPDQPWVLRGLNLTIPPRAAVGLVGVNGAGKSTLVKLLCRFYDPVYGAIRWNGVDLRDLDPAQLRSRIGAVFQDFVSYDLTADENIALGDLQASPARRELAARRAGIHDAVTRLAHGYDTQLSAAAYLGDEERGVSLSGGQWQRLALARAMLREDCELMILDEPSSGLDPQAEHEIHAELVRHRQGRSSLLISHRLNAVRDADLVVVLDGGTVTESGTHDQLMALGGRYASMFTVQASGYGDRQPVVPTATDGRASGGTGSGRPAVMSAPARGSAGPAGLTLVASSPGPAETAVGRHAMAVTPGVGGPRRRNQREAAPTGYQIQSLSEYPRASENAARLRPDAAQSRYGGSPTGSQGLDPEGQLLVQVGRGDRAAFEQLYVRAAPLVFGTILHLMPGVTQAEQVTRDLLVEVWRKAAWFDPGRHTGRAWLVAMARQGAVERARFLAPAHDLGGGSVNGSPITAALPTPVLPRG
jgi:ATP-binding cassette subfamily B protein